MKIEANEPVLAGSWLFVLVHTEEGITGLGEAGLWGYPEASLAVLKSFEPYLIGQDPLRSEGLLGTTLHPVQDGLAPGPGQGDHPFAAVMNGQQGRGDHAASVERGSQQHAGLCDPPSGNG